MVRVFSFPADLADLAENKRKESAILKIGESAAAFLPFASVALLALWRRVLRFSMKKSARSARSAGNSCKIRGK